MGLISESPTGLGEIETLLLKGTYKISHALEPRAEAVTYLLFLESLPEWQKAIVARPGNTDTGNSHSGGLFYPMNTGAGKCHSGILP